MSCKAFGCKKEAKFENGIGVRVCSSKCANKLSPGTHLNMADQHHTMDHFSDPSLILIHKTSPMIGIYRNEPCLILRKGKSNLAQCVSVEHPNYFEVNKKVAHALKTALVGISREEIEEQLEEARREAEEVDRKRRELKKQLKEVNSEERKRKAEQSQEKKKRRDEERRLRKEASRKRRNEMARNRRREAKDWMSKTKEAAKKTAVTGREGEEGTCKKKTGKQLDEMNDDVLLLMIAQLDDESLRALSMVNRRFNEVAFPSLFDKSTDTGKMRFMYLAIVNRKWSRLAYAFSKYESFALSMVFYFRNLFMWTSPWSKAEKFEFPSEYMDDLRTWKENEIKITSEQAESALDLFIRVVFFKEDSIGMRQPVQTPVKLRLFCPQILQTLATFHHLKTLNRFFTDTLWNQIIVIDPKIARQETMIWAANSGFAEYVAQIVADPTIDLTYKNSSVFGVVTGEAYRSPYQDSESFLSSMAAGGPIDIRDELGIVAQTLMKSGRQFEKRNPDAAVKDHFAFYRWNDWWDSENDIPGVIKQDELDGPVTSKNNTSLARAVFNLRREIIDMVLPLHSQNHLTDDIELARMLVYYYPVAVEKGGYKNPSTILNMFDRVMEQSGNKLVPVGLGPQMIYSALDALYDDSEDGIKTLSQSEGESFFSKLRDIMLRDPRLSLEQQKEILDATVNTMESRIPDVDLDGFESSDLDEDLDENEVPSTGPWVDYWLQASSSSSSSS